MSLTLTEIERKILDYMVLYLRTNTYQPSIREIGERFGIKSTKTVSEHLQALADKGHLERDPSRSRGVRILGVDLNPHTVSLPCFNELPEGRGAIRTDRAEMFLTIDRRLAGGKGSFFVRAHGDELAVLGCLDGDYLLVEPAQVEEVQDGAVIAARIGTTSSYYRCSRNGEGIALQPVGSGEPATVVEEPSKLRVFGRLAGLYRRMDQQLPSVSVTAH
jgi:repressor LexA